MDKPFLKPVNWLPKAQRKAAKEMLDCCLLGDIENLGYGWDPELKKYVLCGDCIADLKTVVAWKKEVPFVSCCEVYARPE